MIGFPVVLSWTQRTGLGAPALEFGPDNTPSLADFTTTAQILSLNDGTNIMNLNNVTVVESTWNPNRDEMTKGWLLVDSAK